VTEPTRKRTSPRRFPYSVADAPDGRGVLAEDARGRQLRFTGPAGDKARKMAAAQAALAPTPVPTPAITADAHQFNVLAGGLDLPRTARGGVRDLAPEDAVALEAPAAVDASMASAPAARAPTLAEVTEARNYVSAAQPTDETTHLGTEEEIAFQAWAKKNNIRDVDHPDSHYDYRGYWKDQGGPAIRGGVDHFPDTYKQHGHPTFSIESKYSRGIGDGGAWDGETFRPAPPGGVDTVYEDPAEAERRKAAQAAALQARVKHAADVSFYDPNKPIAL
jgi:hypothetical protein